MKSKIVTEKFLLKNGFKWNKPHNIMEKEFAHKNKNGYRMCLWYYKNNNKFLLDGLFDVYTDQVNIIFENLSNPIKLPYIN